MMRLELVTNHLYRQELLQMVQFSSTFQINQCEYQFCNLCSHGDVAGFILKE